MGAIILILIPALLDTITDQAMGMEGGTVSMHRDILEHIGMDVTIDGATTTDRAMLLAMNAVIITTATANMGKHDRN